jgi:hypothetical protein
MQPAQLIDEWKVIGLLGKGRFSAVYVCNGQVEKDSLTGVMLYRYQNEYWNCKRTGD